MSCPSFEDCPILKNIINIPFCEGYINENPFYIYIVKCLDNTFYTGYTKNLDRRIKEHKSGKGSKWCKVHGFYNYTFIQCGFLNDAMKLEKKIKKWSKEKKEKLFEMYGTYF